jgi:hypothetical protein
MKASSAALFARAVACCALVPLAGCSASAAGDNPSSSSTQSTSAAPVTAAACATGQLTVAGAEQMSPGLGHRGYRLFFALVPGGQPCTLTGYPGVDTTGGDPVIHAERTLSGYLGGPRLPPGNDTLPTVLLDNTHDGMGEVEWVVADASGNSCPPYPGLLVTPPDTTTSFALPAGIDSSCRLQVHPVTAPDVLPEPDILPG